MTWILVVLGLYLAVGVAFSLCYLYVHWKDGEDVMLGDIVLCLVRSPTWPLMILVLLEDAIGKPLSHLVVLRGNKYARTERILKGDSTTSR